MPRRPFPPPRPKPSHARRPALATAAVWLCLSSTWADAQVRRDFSVTTGHVVIMTPVDDLDCRGLGRKLAEIDATGYRGQRPRPADRRDRPLFDYEKQVSRRFYSRCVVGATTGSADPSGVRDVFRKGFRPRTGD